MTVSLLVPIAASAIVVLVLAGATTTRRPEDLLIGNDPRPDGRRRRSARAWPARHRTGHVEAAGVAAWCDDLARTMRHGSTLRSVIETSVPEHRAVALHTAGLRHRLERGASVSAACDEWAHDLDRVSTPGIDALRTLAAVLSTTAVLGGNTAEPIDRFGVAMRQRASDQLERAANSAQARLSARVLTVVPLALLAVLLATDPRVRAAVTSTNGVAVVGLGIVLNAFGAWWMRRIAGASGPTATESVTPVPQ